jgi:two-component system, cell cycle response regulator DivK
MASNTVLVVDDNPANADLVSFILAKTGYDVHIAADAVEAMAMVAELSPKLIMMDLQLPGMDGLELTRRLKANAATRQIIIIALTAYAMKGDEERARQAGCDGYISKPIDTRALPGIVGDYLPVIAGA